MKKILFFLIMSTTLIINGITGYAANDTLWFQNGSMSASYCSSTDSLVLIGPETGIFTPPSGPTIPGIMLKIPKTTNNSGIWIFSSLNYSWAGTFNFVSAMSPNWSGIDSTYCGPMLLNPQPGAGASFVWSTTATTVTITVPQVTVPTWYGYQATNACNSISDSIQILPNPNVPNLGPDLSICLGDSTTMDGGTYSGYIWSNGDITATSTITVTASSTQSVTVTDAQGCKLTDNINIEMLTTFNIEMCDVSYDTVTNKNSINWFVDPLSDIVSVVVWVKNNLGNWVVLDTVPYTQGNYIHMGSNPQGDYNEYKISAINTCGEGQSSTIHRSIWLTELSNELQWQNYMGNFVPSYYIVFARLSSGAINTIDTISACSGAGCINHRQIVSDPNITKYFVAFEHSCSSNKSTGWWVLSNYLDVSTGLLTTAPTTNIINIYPNPASDFVAIKGEGEYLTEISDLLGRLILTSDQKTINTSSLPSGSYLVKITNKYAPSGVGYTTKLIISK